MTARNYMFTIHVESEEQWTAEAHEHIRFLVCQLEMAPTTGQLHWQGYVELKKPARIPQVKGWLNAPTAHLEARRGTQAQAIAYCEKMDTRAVAEMEPTRIGTPSGGQGERSDIAAAVDLIKAGTGGLGQVLEDMPEVFVKYHRGLTAAAEMHARNTSQTIRADLEVIVLVGPPGCGKTRAVYEEAGLAETYTLTQTSGTVWWNGYTGQKNLLLDDYYGWIQWGELLKILDIYPLQVQTKGGFTHVNYTRVYITSNRPWDHWYAKSRSFLEQGALQRRIRSVRTYSAAGAYTAGPPVETPLSAHAPGFLSPALAASGGAGAGGAAAGMSLTQQDVDTLYEAYGAHDDV